VKIARAMAEIEERRGSTLLVFAASNLELELLPALYDSLRAIGRADRLDVLLYGRGGIVNAARRIALLLQEHAGDLSFIVPDRCESSATIMVLAGREIVAGPAAVFSPIDPQLEVPPGSPGEGPSGVSAQDVRLFGEMARDWFGLEEGEARQRALSVLCETIFPTTLTSFYRSSLEVEAIGAELLALHMPPGSEAARARIVEALLYGHHSHHYALTREELGELGLPVRADPAVEDLAWEIAAELRAGVGGGARASTEEDRCDALIATRIGLSRRRRNPDGLMPRWEAGALE
jgi:Serine dehydrogenase proteinase